MTTPTGAPVHEDAEALRSAVLAWGLPRLRDLPWRRTRDAWAVLVSEVMLQQTGVHRVIPKWTAFLEAFPTPVACAAVPLGDVLRLWQGLGYPRRARNLHAASIAIVDRHDGRVPDSLDDLLALPGVGPYTARAVMAFAHELDAAVVDTNIARVFARVGGRRLTAREVQAAADEVLDRGDPWTWNQALMDLGATVCTSATPACPECPLVAMCAWRGGLGSSDGLGVDVADDPAQGSAAVSTRQARFDGSDRQARGRLMRRLVDGQLRTADAAEVMGLASEPARADRLIVALLAEGLVVQESGTLGFP